MEYSLLTVVDLPRYVIERGCNEASACEKFQLGRRQEKGDGAGGHPDANYGRVAKKKDRHQVQRTRTGSVSYWNSFPTNPTKKKKPSWIQQAAKNARASWESSRKRNLKFERRESTAWETWHWHDGYMARGMIHRRPRRGSGRILTYRSRSDQGGAPSVYSVFSL